MYVMRIMRSRCSIGRFSEIAASPYSPCSPMLPESVQTAVGPTTSAEAHHEAVLATIVITDIQFPASDSMAGQTLQANLKSIRDLPRIDFALHDGVDVFDRTRDASMLHPASLVLIGSPAPHACEGKSSLKPGDNLGYSKFKNQVFYSLAWRTKADQVVAMTWSLGACDCIEAWVDGRRSSPYVGRSLCITRANFSAYRPRKGLESTLETLGDEEDQDTMIALILPPQLFSKLVWIAESVLDGPATIAALAMGGRRPPYIVSYSGFTAEMELDVLRAAVKDSGASACEPYCLEECD